MAKFFRAERSVLFTAYPQCTFKDGKICFQRKDVNLLLTSIAQHNKCSEECGHLQLALIMIYCHMSFETITKVNNSL